MEAFRRLISQIGEQIRLLSVSQKVAIALCAVVVTGSLAWLLTWSTTPQTIPLLPQDMTLTELDAGEAALHAAGIIFQTHANRIYVAPADQANALRILNRANALPQDTSIGFNTLIADSYPFRSESENEFRRRVALGNELAAVITSSPDVAAARVFINTESKRGFGAEKSKPTASVQVAMKRGHQLNQGMVEAFARLVGGAVQGLAPYDVNVIDAVSLRAFSVPNPEDVWAADMLDRKKREEGHLLAKILDQLSYVPGVLAGVTVELDMAKTRTRSTTYAPPQPKVEDAHTEKTTSARNSGETGTNPNVGVALSSAGTTSGSETEETKTENFPANPTEVKEEEKMPFAITRASASVSIPRSFLVSIFKAQPGHDKEPVDTDPVFEAIRTEHLERVRQTVKTILMAKSDDDVRVAVYYDFEPGTATLRNVPGTATAEAGIGTIGDKVALVRTYGPAAGLSALAVFGLLVVLLTLRKSVRAAASMATPRRPELRTGDVEIEPEGVLTVPGTGPVGRADMPEGVLQGQEVDENTLRFKQLGDQVTKMVEDDPATAADLLRRWVETPD